ncbi:MAG: hypothetical protein ACNI3H_07495 [Halarcobacter ebronensis]
MRFGGEEFIVLLYNCDEKGARISCFKNKRNICPKKEIPAGGSTTLLKQ